ncbi:hypothetical protein [Clostridium fallax]|uniref:Uncharacterized protein n=1 Tax=Clostridium fallax TaxID=1533 RepID=A0A1M4YHK6_9CLOT|nr:hypothetical protein [Clostridium fallax]SHF05267.1 hypothetical protein SAMN05443638_1283 [Clostridium fallax]SQB06326.1 prepilin-type N-terminal cleavage/methylation domain-containing protein [Clostridium fallax]
MKKRGNTLIELLIYLSLASFIVVISFDLLIWVKKLDFKRKENTIKYNELLNLSFYMEKEIEKRQEENILITDNLIKIKKEEDQYIKIFKNKDKIFIDFNGKRTDTAATDITEFKANKKDNLVYYKLKNSSKGEIIRCLKLKKGEVY